jgi:replicative DNA helicase
MPSSQLPPQSIEAEQAVLGALLIDPSARFEVADLLSPKAFFRDVHGDIYAAVLAVDVPDYLTVTDELKRRGKLSAVGGASYLVDLMNVTPTSVHARYYAAIVAKCHVLREIVRAGHEIAQAPYAQASDVDAVYSRAAAILANVQPPDADHDVLEWKPSLVGYLTRTFERLEELDAPRQTERRPVVLPWAALAGDDRIAQLVPNSLTLLLGETGGGKTAFAECCAESWAEQGLHTVFVHLELSHEFMLHRRMNRQTGIPLARLLRPLEQEADVKRIAEKTNLMDNWPGAITYVDAAGWTATRIAAVLERIHQRHPVDVFIVDYLTMIEPEDKNSRGENVAQATGRQVNVFKFLSKRLRAPGILLAQFNNESDSETWRKSKKTRNSGEVRQKANYIITLDVTILNEDKHDVTGQVVASAGSYDPVVKVIVEKHTGGRCFATKLYYLGARYLWTDVKEDKLDRR